MASLILEGGNRSPSASFDSVTGKFLLEGRSIPENAYTLYAPILDWVRTYIQEPAQVTHLEFKLSYFNSSSTEHLLEIFQLLNSVTTKGLKFTCRWFREADDEDMDQIAQDFMALVGMKFEMVVIAPSQEIEDEDDI
jgi:hypothetical protein